MELRVAATVACTEAEGPHRRFGLWVQGCTLGCPGCCNPSMFDPDGGRRETVATLLDQIVPGNVEGLTILGGEPLEQIGPVTALCRGAAARGLGVLVFSGYRLDEARELGGFEDLWQTIDTLVDGRFDPRQPDEDRRYIGSRNQGLNHRTTRYDDPALWCGPEHAEIRIAPDGTTTVHGMPRLATRVARLLG